MKILNFGSCNVDYVYSLDHIVEPGETETSHALEVFPGGKGLNQSIAVAKAAGKIYHAGCIGKEGEFLAEMLQDNGVDISFIKFVEEKNGHAIIQVSKDGENCIFLYPGSNEMIEKEDIDRVLEHFSQGDMLLLQNEISNLAYLVEKAYQKGLQVVLNPSPYNEKIAALNFHKITYLILNEVEAKAISGLTDVDDILEFWKKEYPNLKLMLTLGKKGCFYQDQKHCVYHPIFSVDVVDTTAAGDAFAGYFVAGVAKGLPYREILKLASCAAALAVSKKGAAPSIPKMEEVLRKMPTLPVRDTDYKTEKTRRKIEHYLDQNYQKVTLYDLAEHLGYSNVYTEKIVKKCTGATFKQLLIDKRLSEAARLLSKTDLPLNEIISKVGYENQSFFRQIFKEKYGANPLAYRKKGDK